MDGIPGRHFRGLDVTWILALAMSALTCAHAAAQTTGTAAFRVLGRGEPIGMLRVAVSQEPDGWRITSTGTARGTVGVTVKQFDARYSGDWRARFLTVERDGPLSSTLMHVVVGPATAHVDIVTAKEARWHSHAISPDTVFLPDHAYGAFAAVAARLNAAGPRAEIPLLLVPDSERRAVVDAWEAVTVQVRSRPVRASRHTLTMIGAVPRQVHVWEAGGDLLRVELPLDEITVVRTDVR